MNTTDVLQALAIAALAIASLLQASTLRHMQRTLNHLHDTVHQERR